MTDQPYRRMSVQSTESHPLVRVRTHHAFTRGEPNGVDAVLATARCRTTLLVSGAVTVPAARVVAQQSRV